MILFTLIPLIRIKAIIIDALIDSYLADARHIKIDHNRHTITAAVLHIALSILFYLIGIDMKLIVIDLIMIMPVRWIVHDLTMNILRGEDWNYVGKGSVLDQKFRGNIWVKIGFLLACIGACGVVVELKWFLN